MGGLSFTVAYLGGLLTIFSPCSALLIPSFFAYAFTSRSVLASRTLIFFLGLLAGLVPAGIALGGLGSFLRLHLQEIALWGGLLIALLGLWQALALPVPHPGRWLVARRRAKARDARARDTKTPGAGEPVRAGAGRRGARLAAGSGSSLERRSSPLGIALLGFTYGLAGSGCSGPILGAVSGFIVTGGSAALGGLTMVFFAAGMFTPVALLAFIWDWAQIGERSWLKPKPLRFLGRDTTWGNLISGGVFILLGLAMALSKWVNLSASLLSPTQQSDLEYWVQSALAGVPNWLFVALFLTLLGFGISFAVHKRAASRANSLADSGPADTHDSDEPNSGRGDAQPYGDLSSLFRQ